MVNKSGIQFSLVLEILYDGRFQSLRLDNGYKGGLDGRYVCIRVRSAETLQVSHCSLSDFSQRYLANTSSDNNQCSQANKHCEGGGSAILTSFTVVTRKSRIPGLFSKLWLKPIRLVPSLTRPSTSWTLLRL